MQGRYRSSGDGFRPGSVYRNSPRGGFSRAHPKPYPSPLPPRKADILMEAGRLAAEYLVFKGLLPPNSLPAKAPNGQFQEFKGEEREHMMMPGARPSALARLGNPGTDVGHVRRRYDDEYYHTDSRRGRRRIGPYSRGYRSEWGNRENGRRGPWMERARGYPGTVEEEDYFAAGYPRLRRGGFDEAGSSASKFGSDERHSLSEVTGESGTEVDVHEMADDTGSKVSSSSTRKDPLVESDADLNKETDDVKVMNSEAGDEVKSAASGDSKKLSMQEGDMDVKPYTDEGDPANKHGDLMQLCSFAKVPTKPRSSVAQRSPKSGEYPTYSSIISSTPGEASSKFKVAAAGVSEIVEEVSVRGSSSDSRTNQTNTTQHQTSVISSTLPDQPMEETVDSQHESSECPPGFVALRVPVDARDEGSFAQLIDKMGGIETPRDRSPPRASQDNDYSLQELGTKKSNPCIETLSTDEQMVDAVDQDKPVCADATLFSNIEPEFNVKLEEEKQFLPTSFDLNLTGTPEITDDPVLDHLHTTAPNLKNGNEIPGGVNFPIGNNSNDDKVIPVINLEDDSPMEDNACDSSQLRNETIYPSLDNFLSQTDNTDIGDGYSLPFSEFLGTDISGCPSVTADLDNLQTEMTLHDAQGVPGDDDSIYVSLEEITIGGFMGVWDQPTQEYGKLF